MEVIDRDEEDEMDEENEFSEQDGANNQPMNQKNEEQSDESSEMTASEDETSWISWFINMRGNDFFCEVDESFIQDDFNLTGLSTQVPYYDHALDMILDIDIPLDSLSEDQHEIIETAAEVLYGLIHARYILSAAGVHKMNGKYQNVDFGRCPRSFCQGQPVLPVGLSDVTREFSVELFCPRCHDTYHPRSSKHSNLDGAYFGTTFCHLFLLTHPELVVSKPMEAYVPRIFGFRVHESSQYYQLREGSTTITQKQRGNGINTRTMEATIVPPIAPTSRSTKDTNNTKNEPSNDQHLPQQRHIVSASKNNGARGRIQDRDVGGLL